MGLLRSTRVFITIAVVAAALLSPALVKAQTDPEMRAMNQPVAPFHLTGNIYYVGASDVTSFLIVTHAGDILLDGGFVQTAPQIESNIGKLGFKLSDVKILLNSHAHYDHAGGLAELKRITGAQFVAMQGDAELLARGGRGDFYFGDRLTFPPIKPDRVIHDGGTVTLGGVTMTAHLTAGHTRGCTTWTMTTEDHGKRLHVVFVGSMSVLSGYRLAGNESYPGMTADYERSFRLLHWLPCDVFLGAHGQFFNLTAKRKALAHSPKQNPFIDPAGYRAYVDNAQRAFEQALREQQTAAQPRRSSELSHAERAGSVHTGTVSARASARSRPPAEAVDLFALRNVSARLDRSGRRQNENSDNERTAAGVMRVEHEWLDALHHRDVKILDRILATEFIDSDWQGDAITRAQYFAYFARPVAHPAPPASQKFDDTKVRFLANGAIAIVTGVVLTEATNEGKSPSNSPAARAGRASRTCSSGATPAGKLSPARKPTSERSDGRSWKAEVKSTPTQRLLHSAFCLLTSNFCLLTSAFRDCSPARKCSHTASARTFCPTQHERGSPRRHRRQRDCETRSRTPN
jgi:metallo-beta-lactamase class B